jgi:hypothetical protein
LLFLCLWAGIHGIGGHGRASPPFFLRHVMPVIGLARNSDAG